MLSLVQVDYIMKLKEMGGKKLQVKYTKKVLK
jgi:hypothetical protein